MDFVVASRTLLDVEVLGEHGHGCVLLPVVRDAGVGADCRVVGEGMGQSLDVVEMDLLEAEEHSREQV